MKLTVREALNFAAIESIDRMSVCTAENAARIVQATYNEIFSLRVDFAEAYDFVLTRKHADGSPKYEP